MKTIIWKELRENFKLAVIGFAIFTFLIVECYRSISQMFTDIAFGQTNWQSNSAQPLLSDRFLGETAIFCAIFGAVLGWLQIHNERHRDLWAFLVHRPISRSKIFFSKVIAGLCLYAAGAALPLLGYIVVAWMPGHFPVPFTLPMVLPLTSLFLVGTVFYFAGLLTGVRQARWYVSRGLGLGAGILLAAFSVRAPDFWRVLLFLVPGALIVATAAWGSFISGGYYEGQPVSSRRALVFSLMLGCFVVISIACGLLGGLFYSPNTSTWTSYFIGKDGTVYKSIQTTGKPPVVTDLNGKTLIDKSTGRPMLQNDFYKILASQSSLYPDFETNTPESYDPNRGYNNSANYFALWRQTVDTLWYWCPNGRLWAYDTMSRRFIGSLGPDGFTRGISAGPGRFTRREGPSFGNGYYDQSYPRRTLLTDTAVYQLDYENRTSKLFFTTTNNERIGGAVDVSTYSGDWNYTIVVTKDSVRVLKPDGTLVTQTPYEPKYPAYDGVQVYFLEPTNNFAFWFSPDYQTNTLLHWALPSHVVWTAGSQGAVKSLDLPSTEETWHQPFWNRLVNVVEPPAVFLITPIGYWRGFSNLAFVCKSPIFWVSVAVAVICAGVGWGLGRRYYFTAKVQTKWAVFNLFFGLPGLLAFICVQEWPARVACPNCKKLRTVDRENCEHCGAAFPPPAKIGTEIFEPVGVK